MSSCRRNLDYTCASKAAGPSFVRSPRSSHPTDPELSDELSALFDNGSDRGGEIRGLSESESKEGWDAKKSCYFCSCYSCQRWLVSATSELVYHCSFPKSTRSEKIRNPSMAKFFAKHNEEQGIRTELFYTRKCHEMLFDLE